MTGPLTTADVILEIRKALPGYEVDGNAPTGGGCYAVVVTAPDGRTCYLTDGSGGLPASAPDDGYVSLSYYDAGGEESGYLTVDLDDGFRDNLRVSLHAWADGDPYVDIDYAEREGWEL